nr:immunoglobulin light chain junction region [Macaca mulatta]MPO05855.1 immunoglobulin light chain junction region [Macaca mulatta]MPO08045.1 immunoglobulin light chain junction region [Macaca mulatta]MPO08756.1 immunoglobulin light chain junction region [Macaca mulatta]MPO10200.1 immunoglobulin light chain junction region [Macaca mulatta]
CSAWDSRLSTHLF